MRTGGVQRFLTLFSCLVSYGVVGGAGMVLAQNPAKPVSTQTPVISENILVPIGIVLGGISAAVLATWHLSVLFHKTKAKTDATAEIAVRLQAEIAEIRAKEHRRELDELTHRSDMRARIDELKHMVEQLVREKHEG